MHFDVRPVTVPLGVVLDLSPWFSLNCPSTSANLFFVCFCERDALAQLPARTCKRRRFQQQRLADSPARKQSQRPAALWRAGHQGRDFDGAPSSLMQIVGIVEDIKEGSIDDFAQPALYVPRNQHPVAWPAILIRTSRPDGSLLSKIAGSVHRLDPYITVSGGDSMIERINQSPSAYLHRSAAWLVGLFAGAAFVLGVVGF